jgi:CRISPR-associated protein Csm5
LTYTPLSPIHIGTGDSYEPTNYVIDNGTLYEFDTDGALAALTETDRNELNRIVNARDSEDMLKAVQRFFYERRDRLKPWAINAIPVLDGVTNLYGNRIGQIANRESDGSQVLNKLGIDRTAYNPVNRQPVLFGSSIKGAIRTALLDQVNQGERASERKGLHEFQGRLFQYRDPERGKLRLEQDPLRLIQLGDAAWNTTQILPTTQIYLAVNRKKSPVTDKKGALRKAMGENLYQILECVPAFYGNGFNGQMTIQHVGLDVPNKLPTKSLRFSITDIATACNRFYLPQLKSECTLLQERAYGDDNWLKQLAELLAMAKERIKTGKVFLLRIGRHSGAEAVTVSGARNGNIKIMKGKGQQPEYADAPKTLWLAANDSKQRTGLLPFGWSLVEIHPGNAPVNDWPELSELCRSQHTQAQQWSEKRAAERVVSEQHRKQQEIERQRRLEEEQIRIAEQKAEEQRRATLTSEQLQIDTLRQQFEQKQTNKVREQIGGRLYGDLRSLIEQAADWPNETRLELLAVAKNIVQYIGAVDNKKAKELLRALQ